MATAVLAGSTGLVGSNILSQLLAHPSFTKVYAYTRRELPDNPQDAPKLHPLLSTDSATWPAQFPHAAKPSVLFSGLGTTRAQTGGFDAQRKIDFVLNLSLARAAKDAGVQTYVLVSSSGASASSYFGYNRMKGELEDSVKALGFTHTVILRPGLIVGERGETRAAEAVLRGVAKGLGRVSAGLTEWWAQDAGVIARAAVEAGVRCGQGEREKGVWVMGMAEIVELGRERK
ncbi:NAD dependent epimerase/dehydratase family protein-like protein [Decorospora gaudefroyi]|uniref:NAD dependent epimerase/dehydratase family protein-like protein n=1 Tax=Decorospora gaudefroyi TaxID=184978 RepID=A0A6A5KB28_9PLEO|nr:NAD dependent epimerase/dehydratase family protein-like protein [Decorospora gaudefroyi]